MLFTSSSEAICFYRTHNPARQKYFNPFEAERRSGWHYEESPDDVFAAVVLSIRDMLRCYDDLHRQVFVLHEIGHPHTGDRYHPVEIAEKLGRKRTTIYNWLRYMRGDLERELIRHKLMSNGD